MADHAAAYETAERALLASEGVTAETEHVELPTLGGRVRVLSSGDGPPVIFVSGAMTSGAAFAGLVGRLPDFRCLMLDRPGTGLSPLTAVAPTDLQAQQRIADTLLGDVMEGLGIERASVVSTSLGGWYTFRSAAATPERIDRICGLAFQVGARMATAPLSMRLVLPPWLLPRRPPVTRRLVKAMLKRAGMRRTVETGGLTDEGVDWMVALLRHTETFRNESLYNPRPIGLRGSNDEVRHSEELLAAVRAPVHLFWGCDDLFGGEDAAREFASALPESEVQMVPRAGHAPWLDEPDLAADAVRRHLSAD